MPRCSLFYAKIEQIESRNAKLAWAGMPRCSLFYAKLVHYSIKIHIIAIKFAKAYHFNHKIYHSDRKNHPLFAALCHIPCTCPLSWLVACRTLLPPHKITALVGRSHQGATLHDGWEIVCTVVDSMWCIVWVGCSKVQNLHFELHFGRNRCVELLARTT